MPLLVWYNRLPVAAHPYTATGRHTDAIQYRPRERSALGCHLANLSRIQKRDAHRHAAFLRGYLIDRLDKCFLPSHPLGILLKDIAPALQECGYSPVDVMQRIQVALFPEEFLPDEEAEELKRIARNKKHQSIAGLLPGSERMQARRLEAFIKLTIGGKKGKKKKAA